MPYASENFRINVVAYQRLPMGHDETAVLLTPPIRPRTKPVEGHIQRPIARLHFLATTQTDRFHRVEARQRSGLPGAKRMPAGRRSLFGFLDVAL